MALHAHHVQPPFALKYTIASDIAQSPLGSIVGTHGPAISGAFLLFTQPRYMSCATTVHYCCTQAPAAPREPYRRRCRRLDRTLPLPPRIAQPPPPIRKRSPLRRKGTDNPRMHGCAPHHPPMPKIRARGATTSPARTTASPPGRQRSINDDTMLRGHLGGGTS
ncbi:hypothetical protein MSAN_01922700 [Mycena sanguinolenta]|uniref:Uncharacterized protein n=1 Tax=Mycena sanguinolenta TaxID=230812 RepID=A0A8H6XMG8_9AGAR|nr:hypothetical protein MSAN_01922700 [Mycena sanguinolenta]